MMKQRKISKEKYIELFCRDNRIREREVIYVSRKTHRNFKMIAGLFSKQYVTVSSLVDAILSHHVSIHKDMLNGLMHKEDTEFWQSLSRRKATENEGENETEDSHG